MSAHPAAYIAYTAPINPKGVSPAVTIDQVWAALHRKTHHAEEFVGNAISKTDVISETKDDFGRDVVTRDVVFVEGNRTAREVCTYFPPMKVEFLQTDGTKVLNTVSEGASGELYLTYQFEWLMEKGTPIETQEANTKKWKEMSKTAVEHSIEVIREMVQDGRIK